MLTPWISTKKIKPVYFLCLLTREVPATKKQVGSCRFIKAASSSPVVTGPTPSGMTVPGVILQEKPRIVPDTEVQGGAGIQNEEPTQPAPDPPRRIHKALRDLADYNNKGYS